MLLFTDLKMRLVGMILLAGVCAFAQAPKRQTAQPDVSKSPVTPQKTEPPKFKAIWEPVNVKNDIELSSVHFTSPEEGWVAGGQRGQVGTDTVVWLWDFQEISAAVVSGYFIKSLAWIFNCWSMGLHS